MSIIASIVVEDIIEIAAAEFFEVGSEQRLSILSELAENNTTISKIAKKD